MKVVIVESRPTTRRLLRSLLEELPLWVRECRDLSSASALCARENPDCVVLDLDTEQEDALQAVSSIRATCPEARIIAVTGDDDVRLAAAALGAGATRCMAKENLLEIRELVASRVAHAPHTTEDNKEEVP